MPLQSLSLGNNLMPINNACFGSSERGLLWGVYVLAFSFPLVRNEKWIECSPNPVYSAQGEEASKGETVAPCPGVSSPVLLSREAHLTDIFFNCIL